MYGGVEERVVIDDTGRFLSVTTVLWVSRHDPLLWQVAELRRLLGPVKVIQLSGRIPSAEYIAEKAREHGAKVVVPVLPLSMIARLVELARDFEVWWAEMEQVAQGKGEPPRYDEYRETILTSPEGWKVMRFVRFHRVKAVRIESEPL